MPLDMARVITQSEYDDLWDEAKNRGEVTWHHDHFERWRPLPKALGQGEVRIIDLQPGLTLTLETSFYQRPIYLDYYYSKRDKLLSNFYLAGSRRMINPGIQLEDDREETAGEACLCYISEARSIEYFPAEQPLKHLHIAIDLDWISSFGMEQANDSPLLKKIMAGKSLDSFHLSLNAINPVLQQTLCNILSCPYQGTVKRIYLESKVLELLALQFHQLAEIPNSASPHLNLRPADMERLHLAREILQQQFDAPPSLFTLARQVGLNDCKLKQGFRQLFGTTVFGYLQRYRIEQAEELLRDRDQSIADIAHRVGYASPSQFCHAFKRHLGITPSAYRHRP